MKKAQLIFLWIFGGWIAVFCSPVFAVSGLYLDKSENPLFSCVVLYLNDSHIGTDGIDGIGGLCSGEFIGKNKFLTAGHCNDGGFDHAFINCAEYDEQLGEKVLYAVTDIQLHPKYSGAGSPYDLAVLTVERDIPFAPVELPKNEGEIQELLRKEDCVIFGYGMNDDNTFGKQLGVSIEFNGALFGPGLVGIGGFSYPRQGDSGAALLCRTHSDSPWIRIGAVSQAEIGLANAALLSHSLSWISEQIETKRPGEAAQNRADFETFRPFASQNRRGLAEPPDSPPQNRKSAEREEYDRCVSRLQTAAVYDDSGYIKNNMEHVVNMQCGLPPSLSAPVTGFGEGSVELLSQYFDDKDMETLFGWNSLNKTESAFIQTVSEAYSFRKISPGENLCELTADNLFADGDSGWDTSTFTVKIESGEEIEFRVEFFAGCYLTVSYPYNYKCQSCGIRSWGRHNALVRARCDSIYVNADKSLICERHGDLRAVNLNYLRFLNRHKRCFADKGSYHPSYPALSAEWTFYNCIYDNASSQALRPLSLCSLNQLLFAEGTEDLPEFQVTDFNKRYKQKLKRPDCTQVYLNP